jgi:bifunctional UDP-N-acetylglucosamine pyrophosphorylase/glucosamine-1-phosphate N-acetyltransferase
MNKRVKIVILAAGKGTRMKSEMPKVLMEVDRKPMIGHLLAAIKDSGVDDKPVIVVGYKKEEVMRTLGDKYEYAFQEEQLGTGHAVMSAESLLKNKSDNIMVLPSDHPFITSRTIRELANRHIESQAKITTIGEKFFIRVFPASSEIKIQK